MKFYNSFKYNFVCTDRDMVAKGGGYTFRTYPDKTGAYTGTPGMDAMYDDGTRLRGVLTGKTFSMNQSHYNLQAMEGQTDNNKRKLVDFFLCHPGCEGSPNGEYQSADGRPISDKLLSDREGLTAKIKSGEITQLGVKFRLMDGVKDAKLKLETGKRRAEAQVSACEIDDDTLKEVAAVAVGIFGEADDIMRDAVYEYAGRKPMDYFKLLETGDRAIRAIIRRSIADGTMTMKGTSIYWAETLIGSSEDTAVSTLQSDNQMLESLQESSNIKTQVKVTPPKRVKAS